MRRRHRGLTLVEMLVAIAVVALLVALLLPAAQAAREAARRMGCAGNLRTVGLALHQYLDTHLTYPSGYATELRGRPLSDAEYGPGIGWAGLILPFVEQGALFNAANLEYPVCLEPNQTFRSTRLAVYLCPSGPRAASVRYQPLGQASHLFDMTASNYVAAMGRCDVRFRPGVADGVFSRNSAHRPNDIPDGLGQTVFVGERSSNLMDATWVGVVFTGSICTDPAWQPSSCFPSTLTVLAQTGPAPDGTPPAGPGSPAARGDAYWSLHPAGCQFLLGDSSVRTFRRSIHPAVFSALTSRAGGEIIDSHDL